MPALLALGQEREADGAACVDAFIVGVEVMARLGEALNTAHYFKGWHTTSTLGAPAAAAACARLLRLDAARTTAALSLATSLSSGSKRQFGTMAKPVHAGLAAKNGIMAAALAESGVTAAADAYEGERGFADLFAGVPRERLEAAVADFSVSPAIERHGLWQKVYPCCGSVHRPLDALLDMRGDGDLGPQAVAGIDALVAEVEMHNLPYTAPADAMQARFSLPYLLASALVDGRLALDAFTADALARPDVRTLIPRIRMRPDPDQPGGVSAGRGGAAGDGHGAAHGWRWAIAHGARAEGPSVQAARPRRASRQVRGLRLARPTAGRTRRGFRGVGRARLGGQPGCDCEPPGSEPWPRLM